jgi:soluble P-type ATPase
MEEQGMIEIIVPGSQTLHLQHLVMDYNGTLAKDGHLLEGLQLRLDNLAERLDLHVITADTFGQAQANLAGLPCKLVILPMENQAQGKLAYIENLGCDKVAAIGNGRNDRLMLESAALGIAVIQEEGAAFETVSAADVICTDIRSALDMLLSPKRLVATLRL